MYKNLMETCHQKTTYKIQQEYRTTSDVWNKPAIFQDSVTELAKQPFFFNDGTLLFTDFKCQLL